MSIPASQITGDSTVCLTVCLDWHQRKHQRPPYWPFVMEIQRWPVVSPHKRPVTRKRFTFDDVIMIYQLWPCLPSKAMGIILPKIMNCVRYHVVCKEHGDSLIKTKQIFIPNWIQWILPYDTREAVLRTDFTIHQNLYVPCHARPPVMRDHIIMCSLCTGSTALFVG